MSHDVPGGRDDARRDARSGLGATCGIDVGTQGVRAVVVSAAGEVLGSGEAPIAGDSRSGVRHTQPADAWWDALVGAVRGAAQTGGRAVEITALALDATSGTVVVEAADGSPRGPGLVYDDSRAVEQAVRAQSAGSQLWAELGYRIQPSWALPKVLWLLDEDVLGPGDRVVHKADHLLRRLTVTGQGDGCWLVDDDGRGVRPAVSWTDGRAGAITTRLCPGSLDAAITGHHCVGAVFQRLTGVRAPTPPTPQMSGTGGWAR